MIPRHYHYRENVAIALQTVTANKFRSFLTVLGIIIGVLTVIVIASILTGLRENVVGFIEEFGTDNIYALHISMGPSMGSRNREEWRRKPLTIEDAKAIRDTCPSVRDVAWEGIARHSKLKVQYQGNVLRRFRLRGVPSSYAAVSQVELQQGRFFVASEDQRKLNVCVLGTDAREALFSFADPIGKTILVNGRPFTVVGTMADSKGSMMGDNERDGAVLIPYGTYRKLMPWEEMHLLMIQSKEGMIKRALDEVESLLRRRRKVKSNEPSNFELSTADKFIEEFDSITATVGLIAIAISSIGLLVGGIGVMNIMLVSVTERTREIGIRKAIGATRADIVFQFLFEAMTLTGIGGIFGVLLAVAVSYIIVSQIPDLPAIIPTWAIITGLGVSVAIGLLFGVWPARKAAQLDPIEALRYE